MSKRKKSATGKAEHGWQIIGGTAKSHAALTKAINSINDLFDSCCAERYIGAVGGTVNGIEHVEKLSWYIQQEKKRLLRDSKH